MKVRMLRNALGSVSMQLFATQMMVAASALIVNIFAARALGPEARGELALFMQIAYVANTISVLGRHRSYLKLDNSAGLSLAASHKDMRNLSRLPLIISILVAIVVTAFVTNALATGLLFTVGMFALIYSGIQQKTFRASAIVARDARLHFIGTVVGQLILLISAISLTIFGVDDVAIWILVYGGAVMLPYLILSLVLTNQNPDVRSSDENLRRTRILGLKLMPMSAAEMIGSRADRFLIPVLANFAQLGIYTVVATMTELIAWPVKNYTDSRVPEWSLQIFNSRLKLLKEIGIVSALIASLSVIMGLGLTAILVPLFGEEYAPGLELVWPLVLSAALHAWTQFGANINLAAGFTTIVNIVPIAGMITSGLFYFTFIPTMGALGAAWGLVIGYSLSSLISAAGIIRIARKQYRATRN